MSSVQPMPVRGALSMETEGGDLGVRGHAIGMFPPPFMGRRHSHFEDRSAVSNVSSASSYLPPLTVLCAEVPVLSDQTTTARGGDSGADMETCACIELVAETAASCTSRSQTAWLPCSFSLHTLHNAKPMASECVCEIAAH